jgi:hypothetical protein
VIISLITEETIMNKAKYILVVFVMLGLYGCAATLPAPQPLDPQRAIIGISVKTRAPIKAFSDKPHVVYFIKVDREEDLYAQGNFIRSNYAKDGQVYLLNVKPGRYAAVGCYKKVSVGKLAEYTTFFPKELVELTEATVAPGAITFMGEYVIGQTVGLKDADDCQRHYCQVIAPGASTGTASMVLLGAFTGHGDYYYKGSLYEKHRDKAAEMRFLANALEHFEGTGWTNLMQKRIAELKTGQVVAKKVPEVTREQNLEQLIEDLEKYKKIESSDLDEATKLAAWGTLERKYPEWAAAVEPGDSGALLSRAFAADTDASLRTAIELEKKPTEKKRVASIPKVVEKPIIPTGKLRDTPKDLVVYDVERMIEKYNFYEKHQNKAGDFPNDLVDNGDGTITDRATGLMWEKGGSSSQLRYRNAQKYVSRLNEQNFLGHNDWRIPTLVELCSLLEPGVNERGQHISSVFEGKQSKCLAIDPFVRTPYAQLCGTRTIVDFTKGKIDESATENIGDRNCQSVRYFIRAVRTIK